MHVTKVLPVHVCPIHGKSMTCLSNTQTRYWVFNTWSNGLVSILAWLYSTVHFKSCVGYSQVAKLLIAYKHNVWYIYLIRHVLVPLGCLENKLIICWCYDREFPGCLLWKWWCQNWRRGPGSTGSAVCEKTECRPPVDHVPHSYLQKEHFTYMYKEKTCM